MKLNVLSNKAVAYFWKCEKNKIRKKQIEA